jgi:hypothetical protein
MSQELQVIYNNTNAWIPYVNYNGEDNTQTVRIGPGQMMRATGQFNIPDNSDPCTYWSYEHSEIQIGDSAIFSFWDDDSDSYNIKYINGNNCKTTPMYMPGYYNGGNGQTVDIVVSGNSSTSYSILACELQNN